MLLARVIALHIVLMTTCTGWWTYEYCVGSHVRQFHLEGETVANDINLGNYDASTPKRNLEETVDADGVYEEVSSDVIKALTKVGTDSAMTRYAVQYYNGGTPCDIGSQEMRSTDVRLYCGEAVSKSQSFIESVQVSPVHALKTIERAICTDDTHPSETRFARLT